MKISSKKKIIEQKEYCGNGASIIEIPNSVEQIKDEAFLACGKLQSIVIPQSVACIGKGAFKGCESLITMAVDGNNSKYDSRDNCNAIVETTTNTIVAGCNKTIISDSIEAIGDEAFSFCKEISPVLSNNITSIGKEAFSFCEGLTSIIIPKSVKHIGLAAFSDCVNLKSIIVDPENTIYDSRDNCNAIIETATNTLLAGCDNTIIPDSVTKIAPYAFCGCENLKNITIPAGVTEIGEYAFSKCRNITTIRIPKGVTAINEGAFYQCNSLNTVELSEGVKLIGKEAFVNCCELKSINIPDSVTGIFGDAFYLTPFENDPHVLSLKYDPTAELREKYYGKKNVSILVCKGVDIIDAINNVRDSEGYLYTQNKKLRFRNFLPLPGENKTTSSGKESWTDPDCYFDTYEEVQKFGLNVYLADEDYIWEDERRYNLFNKKHFANFAELYKYFLSEYNEKGKKYGLGKSVNVVEDATRKK